MQDNRADRAAAAKAVALKAIALAELASMDTAVNALATIQARLVTIPERLDLPEAMQSALLAEILDALATVTLTLEKMVLDLQDRLEQETHAKDH
jgi:hypothetical protein